MFYLLLKTEALVVGHLFEPEFGVAEQRGACYITFAGSAAWLASHEDMVKMERKGNWLMMRVSELI